MKFAGAIIMNDGKLFQAASQEVGLYGFQELKWLVPLIPDQLQEGMGREGQQLMLCALEMTVRDSDGRAAADIISFCQKLGIIASITEETITLLAKKQDY